MESKLLRLLQILKNCSITQQSSDPVPLGLSMCYYLTILSSDFTKKLLSENLMRL